MFLKRLYNFHFTLFDTLLTTKVRHLVKSYHIPHITYEKCYISSSTLNHHHIFGYSLDESLMYFGIIGANSNNIFLLKTR